MTHTTVTRAHLIQSATAAAIRIGRVRRAGAGVSSAGWYGGSVVMRHLREFGPGDLERGIRWARRQARVLRRRLRRAATGQGSTGSKRRMSKARATQPPPRRTIETRRRPLRGHTLAPRASSFGATSPNRVSALGLWGDDDIAVTCGRIRGWRILGGISGWR
jgi:hypothetical protein